MTDQLDLDPRTRRQRRWVLGLAIVFGVIGGLFLTAAAVVVAPPLVIVLVACVPVLVLGLAAALTTLVRSDARGES